MSDLTWKRHVDADTSSPIFAGHTNNAQTPRWYWFALQNGNDNQDANRARECFDNNTVDNFRKTQIMVLNKNILIQETSNIFQIRATIEAIESGS